MPSAHRVAVVVDPGNGESVPEVRAGSGVHSLETGVTTFAAHATAEESFVSILDSVELHHGEYSHDPPLTVIEVVGADGRASVPEHLAAYGFRRVEPSGKGFTAFRDLDNWCP